MTTDHKLLTSFRFYGNIVPNEWYKRIKTEAGNTDLLAISLLSELLYWHRLREVRDPASGETIGFEKRFSGDLFRLSYDSLAEKFGDKRRNVQSAITRLHKLGLIFRDTLTRTLENGEVVRSSFVALNADAIIKISTPAAKSSQSYELSDVPRDTSIGTTCYDKTYHLIPIDVHKDLDYNKDFKKNKDLEDFSSKKSSPHKKTHPLFSEYRKIYEQRMESIGSSLYWTARHGKTLNDVIAACEYAAGGDSAAGLDKWSKVVSIVGTGDKFESKRIVLWEILSDLPRLFLRAAPSSSKPTGNDIFKF